MTKSSQTRRSVSILFLVLLLTHYIHGSHNLNPTQVSIWCKEPITSTSEQTLNTLATNISSFFNITLTAEVMNLNFATENAYDILNSTREYKKDSGMFVITTLGLKDSWIFWRILGNTETVVVDVLHPGQDERSMQKIYIKNYINLVPPVSEKLHIIKDILDHMLCKEIANITCLKSEESNLRSQLSDAKEMSFCIVVHCTEELPMIFTLAKEYGLFEPQYHWALTNFVEIDATFLELPENLISVELSHSTRVPRQGSTDCGEENILNDALMLVANLGKDLGSKFVTRSMRRNILGINFAGKTGQVYFESNLQARKGSQYDIFQLIRLPNVTGWHRIGSWENNSFDTTLKSWIQHEVSIIKPPLLRIATKRSKPWVYFTADQEIDGKTLECNVGMKCFNYTRYVSENNNSFVVHCCSGMLVELLQELKKRVPFTPKLHFVKDKKFGSRDAVTGNWNGMIGEVLRSEADTALYSLTITGSRSKVVDFSFPFLAAGSGIIISTQRQNSYPYLNDSFLRPFSRNLWIITLAIFAGCVLILWCAERWNRGRMNDVRPRGMGRFMESMSYTWGVVVQKVVQEGGPRTFGGRILTAVFGFYMIILLSTYTANLAAIQVVEEGQKEISGIYDDKFINPTDSFKFTSSKFTATSEFFRHSPDPRMKRIYHVMKDRLVSTRAEALALMKSGEIQAFFEDTPSLHYMASQQASCDLKVVGKAFGNSGYGMPFRPNSTWLRKMSAALREMHEDGTTRKLSKKWLESGCISEVPNTARELGLRDESGLLFLLACVCVGSFVILALEFICVRVFANCFDSHSRSFIYQVTKHKNILK